jgi:hypothetical protein
MDTSLTPSQRKAATALLFQLEHLRKNQEAMAAAAKAADELARKEAEAAGEILKAGAALRQQAQAARDADLHSQFADLIHAGGGFTSFDDLIAEQQKRFNKPPDTSLSLTDQIEMEQRQSRAASLAYLDQLQNETDATDQAFQNIGESLRNSIAGELADFFTDGILQAKNFGDAIRSLAQTVVRSIQQIVAQLLAAQIVKGIAGAIFGGGIPAAPAISGGLDLAGLPGLASGGLVSGPGGPRSDSIMARLSNGEFVVNAEATAANLGLLYRINSHRNTDYSPRFADGGFVGGGGELTATIHATHDPGVVLKIVDSNFPVLVHKHRRSTKGLAA